MKGTGCPTSRALKSREGELTQSISRLQGPDLRRIRPSPPGPCESLRRRRRQCGRQPLQSMKTVRIQPQGAGGRGLVDDDAGDMVGVAHDRLAGAGVQVEGQVGLVVNPFPEYPVPIGAGLAVVAPFEPGHGRAKALFEAQFHENAGFQRVAVEAFGFCAGDGDADFRCWSCRRGPGDLGRGRRSSRAGRPRGRR